MHQQSDVLVATPPPETLEVLLTERREGAGNYVVERKSLVAGSERGRHTVPDRECDMAECIPQGQMSPAKPVENEPQRTGRAFDHAAAPTARFHLRKHCCNIVRHSESADRNRIGRWERWDMTEMTGDEWDGRQHGPTPKTSSGGGKPSDRPPRP